MVAPSKLNLDLNIICLILFISLPKYNINAHKQKKLCDFFFRLTMIFDDSSEALPQPENKKLFLRNPPKDHPITNYWKTDLNTLIDYFRTHHLAPKYVIFNKVSKICVYIQSTPAEFF